MLAVVATHAARRKPTVAALGWHMRQRVIEAWDQSQHVLTQHHCSTHDPPPMERSTHSPLWVLIRLRYQFRNPTLSKPKIRAQSLPDRLWHPHLQLSTAGGCYARFMILQWVGATTFAPSIVPIHDAHQDIDFWIPVERENWKLMPFLAMPHSNTHAKLFLHCLPSTLTRNS